MTDKKFRGCYELGEQVYEGKISRTDAVDKLIDDYEMPKSSANMYIQFFKDMMVGKEYKRAVSHKYIRYYLNNILEHYDTKQLKISLQGLKAHILYKESYGVSVPGVHAIYNEYKEKLD